MCKPVIDPTLVEYFSLCASRTSGVNFMFGESEDILKILGFVLARGW